MKQKEKDGYIESLKPFTDRELLELNTYHSRKSADSLNSIHYILNFFFMLTVISIIIGIIYLISSNS